MRRFLIIFYLLPLLLAPTPSKAGKRVALVIGNNAYQNMTSLNNPVIDAQRLAKLLVASGFDVISCDGKKPGCYNLDKSALDDALEVLEERAEGADTALVFYAGHGLQVKEGNVLAPVDIKGVSCQPASNKAKREVLLRDVIKKMAGAKRQIMLLDACRNDPLPQCPARGFIPMSFGSFNLPKTERILLMSSTKPGQVAQDGLAGSHSPFARALFHWLEKQPGIYFDQLLDRVSKRVISQTTKAGFTQVPEMLIRGGAPEDCLSGKNCEADPQAAALRAQLAALKKDHARDQQYASIGKAFLAKAGLRSAGKPLSEDEKKRALAAVKALGQIKPQDAPDDRKQQALARLQEGDEAAAEKLFAQILTARRTEAKLANQRETAANSEAAQAARHIAALARTKDVVKAAKYYQQAAELQRDSIEYWIDYGETVRDTGDSDAAVKAFRKAIEAANHDKKNILGIKANYRLGDVLVDRGSRPSARRFYERSLELAKRRIKDYPENRKAERELSVSHEKIGDVLVAAGRREEALESYHASLLIRERLAKSDAGHAGWQRDLYVSYWRISDMEQKKGDLKAALREIKKAHLIMERLAKSDAGHAGWQRDLSVSHDKIGNVLVAAGRREEALASYRASLLIRERLAKSDAGHAGWQTDLVVSYFKLSRIDQEKTHIYLKKSLAILVRLKAEGRLSKIKQRWIGIIEKKLAANR